MERIDERWSIGWYESGVTNVSVRGARSVVQSEFPQRHAADTRAVKVEQFSEASDPS